MMTALEVPSLGGIQAKLARAKGRRDTLLQTLSSVRAQVLDLTDEVSLLDHVETLFRSLIDAEISQALGTVESLQTEALQAVFSDQDLSVRADISTDRGKVAVSLVTVQKDLAGEVTEGECNESFGGSVTTVESLLLRLLVMVRRGLRPMLVMDEALPAFDSNYASNMGQFLRLVCKRMGVDMLMVTHNPMLFESAQRAYRIKRHPDGAKFDLVSEEQ